MKPVAIYRHCKNGLLSVQLLKAVQQAMAVSAPSCEGLTYLATQRIADR